MLKWPTSVLLFLPLPSLVDADIHLPSECLINGAKMVHGAIYGIANISSAQIW